MPAGGSVCVGVLPLSLQSSLWPPLPSPHLQVLQEPRQSRRVTSPPTEAPSVGLVKVHSASALYLLVVIGAEHRTIRDHGEVQVRACRTLPQARSEPVDESEGLHPQPHGARPDHDGLPPEGDRGGKPTPTTTTTTTATTTTVPPTTTTTVPPTTIATPPPPTTTSSTTSTTTTTTTTTQPSQQFPGISSPNWSGYVLTGGNGGYQAVSAEWTVPPVDCSSAPNSATSDWVGVNGFGNANPGLFQDGTTSFCLDGQEGDYAWWTDEAESYNSIILFAVSPGDRIDADIYQEASGYWAYFIRDLTSGLQSTALESFAGPGTSAEWIAEDPGDPTTDSPYPRALRVGDLHRPRIDGALRLVDGAFLLRCSRDGWARRSGRGAAERGTGLRRVRLISSSLTSRPARWVPRPEVLR